MLLMQKYDVKTMIFSSSATVYGVENQKAVETDKIVPGSPYGQTKAIIE
jgi:UDP-glucose 4-epimerase